MDMIKKNMLSIVSNRYYMMVFIVTLIFIAVALYTYRRYVSKKINPSYVPNNEFIQEPKSDVVDLYYFYTTWCPHCKKSMPIWQSFKSDIGDNKFKGYRINFLEVDCDKDKATADKFNVQGYPTIKLVKGNTVVEYDAKVSKDTLVEFLNSSL
jgi:thiol-disulfide isomerase/thioredoxin